jgi:hypothetical protein
VPGQADETRKLRELHEHYAWRVNAAVAEGRDDLVWRLSDEYLAEATQLMQAGHATSLGIVAPAAARREPHRESWLTRVLRHR